MARPLRLCLIATDAISLNVLYRGQLEFLQMAGADLTVVCGGSASEILRLRQRRVARVFDLGLLRRPAPLSDLLALVRLVWHLARRRYDVVLCTTPKALLLGCLASWLTLQRKRVAFFQGRVYENAGGLKRAIYSSFDRLSIAVSTHAVFVSSSLRELYMEEGLLKPGSGEVVGAGSANGVDTELFRAERFSAVFRKSVRDSLFMPRGAVLAVVIGRVCKDKGMGELVQLARQLANEKLVFLVVGPVEVGYQAEAAGLLALPNVRHVPFTPDVAQYFAVADVHIMLSHREGFGNVAVEAAACGVPTIAFDVVGVRDSVAEGISGLRIPRGDLGRMEKMLREVRRDPQAFRERFAGARDWAVRHYSSHQVWRAYLDYFQMVIK